MPADYRSKEWWRQVYYDDSGRPRMGTVYLLCFDDRVPRGDGRSFGRHYLGWTRDFAARMGDHRTGRGSRMSWHALQAEIDFTVSLALPGTIDDERGLKEQAMRSGCGYSSLCSFCSD
jgi:hypothetical protein